MGRTKPYVTLIQGIPMLSIGKLANGQDNYYAKLAAERYHCSGGEPRGVYLPTNGTRALCLSGTVSKEDLHALFHGRAPDGTPLVQNVGSPDRRPGYDLTFSAPKSVSVLWAMASENTRHTIQRCQLDAVTEAIQQIEREAAFTRRGKAGSEIARAGMVVVAFEHGSNRALDACLHTHALAMNAATRADGTTGALESKPLYDYKMVAGAVYRAQLAHLLQERLGVQLVRKGSSFEVAGVPQQLCDSLSKRRQEIVKRLNEKGLTTAAAAAVAALDTRQAKGTVPPRCELFAQWHQTGAQFGFAAEHVSRLLHRTRPQNDPARAAEIVDQAVRTVLERSATLDAKTLLRETLYAAVEHGLHPGVVGKAVDLHLTHATDVIKIFGSEQAPRYTTAYARGLQKDIAQSVKKMSTTQVRPPSSRMVNAAISQFSKPRDPTVEELKYHMGQLVRAASKQKTWRIDRDCIARRAQRTPNDTHIASIKDIALSRARVKTVTHASPDDRYMVLTGCCAAWQRAGYNVLGVSLSNAGVKRLYQETGIETMSLKRLELRMHPTTTFQLKYHARQLWRAARNKPTYALEPLKIAKDTVLVVDGAERLTFQQMATLTRDVARQGGRLILAHGHDKEVQGLSHTAFHSIHRQLHEPQPNPQPQPRPTRDQAIDQLINRQMWPHDTSRRFE
jgi:conjugative relaxase-like TrwC/TraI family protein